MQRHIFTTGEYYHVYNRGTERRVIFRSEEDRARFFLCMREFNTIKPIGSIFELQHSRSRTSQTPFGSPTSKKATLSQTAEKQKEKEPLVKFIAYCLNPNHYHFVVQQVAENGVSKFMQRLAGGYTKYFNERYKRSGVLFQGKYKCKHVSSNEYLLRVVSYVNLNTEAHGFGSSTSKSCSSWGEYIGMVHYRLCDGGIVLGQFGSSQAYEKYARDALADIIKNKDNKRELLELEVGLPKRQKFSKH